MRYSLIGTCPSQKQVRCTAQVYPFTGRTPSANLRILMMLRVTGPYNLDLLQFQTIQLILEKLMKHFFQTGCQFEPLYLYAPVGLPYPSPQVPACFFYTYPSAYQTSPLLSASALCLSTSSPQTFLAIQGGPTEEVIDQKRRMRTQNIYRSVQQPREGSKNSEAPRKPKQLGMGWNEAKYTQKNGSERFIKKNTESNVVNQVFSFLWSPEKSRQILAPLLSAPQIEAFYQLMRALKINCRPQLNRFLLKQLCSENEWEGVLRRLRKKVKRIEQVPQNDMARAVRILVGWYLREASRCSIMTSKKMNPKLWGLHFRKCQELRKFLFRGEEQ